MDYTQFKIKEYDNWDLFLHSEQYPYIGRCYAWARREDADLVTDINKEEVNEFYFTVLQDWQYAVKNLFNHDRPNTTCLGNTSPHLHYHMIPRYNEPREFGGITFEDPRPTRNPSPYPKKELDVGILYEIRDLIGLEISKKI